MTCEKLHWCEIHSGMNWRSNTLFPQRDVFIIPCPLCSQVGENDEIKDAFFWDYSGIAILGIGGICVLLGAIPFSE